MMDALFTPTEMALIDAAAPDHGVTLRTLMDHAGTAVARAIMHRFRPCRVLVLAGPGNNGGDGFVAARVLAQRGWPVGVAVVAKARAGTDAAWAASMWHGPTVEATPARVRAADLVIDAVFGAGLARDVGPDVAALLGCARQIVAIDVPSGVDGATGARRGAVAQAVLTVTFVARKPGHLLLPGRDLCGRVICADIGMPHGAIGRVAPSLWHNDPSLWRLPVVGAASHKYDRGHLTILSGTMAGASLLAANAARRAGAGLVSLAADDAVDGAAPGIMCRTDSLAALLDDQRRTVWLCGPGLGIARAGTALDMLIAARRHIIADADALGAGAADPGRLRGVAIITPHAGEFARLFPDLKRDRLANARDATRMIDAVVVLKGADTIIAAPDGRAAINDNAPPTLATAGSGDTLAGIVAGLVTQGMADFEAACAAVWLHGAAAERVGAGLIAEDLAEALPGVLTALRKAQNTT